MPEQEDHDQRLKAAVKSKFSDAIDLLLPDWVPLFDYSKIEWIEQEIFPDPPRGERREIDILAKLPTIKPMMKIPETAKAKAKLDALQKIASSSEPEMRKFLLCECVNSYLPLEEPQMEEFEQMLITQPYQGVRKYGKTWFEQGREEGEKKGKVEGELKGERKMIRKQMAHRFGTLSEQVNQRLEACTEVELFDLAEKILTASSLSELGLER